MISIKDETLQGCLQKVGLPSLPDAIASDGSDGKTFLKAIVLVKRINGQESYCIARNDGYGKPEVIQDFGPYLPIHSIVSIHPVVALDKKVIPDLQSDEDIITYLCKSLYNEADIRALLDKGNKTPEQIKKDRAMVNGYIRKAAIDFATRQEKEVERVKESKTYKSRITNGRTKKTDAQRKDKERKG